MVNYFALWLTITGENMKIIDKVCFLLLVVILFTACSSAAEIVGIDQKWQQEVTISELENAALTRSAEEQARAQIRVAEEQAEARIGEAVEERKARSDEAFYSYKSWQVLGRTVFGVVFLWIAFLFMREVMSSGYRVKLIGRNSSGVPIVAPVELQKLQEKTGAIVRWGFTQAEVQLPDGRWEIFLLEGSTSEE